MWSLFLCQKAVTVSIMGRRKQTMIQSQKTCLFVLDYKNCGVQVLILNEQLFDTNKETGQIFMPAQNSDFAIQHYYKFSFSSLFSRRLVVIVCAKQVAFLNL